MRNVGSMNPLSHFPKPFLQCLLCVQERNHEGQSQCCSEVFRWGVGSWNDPNHVGHTDIQRVMIEAQIFRAGPTS